MTQSTPRHTTRACPHLSLASLSVPPRPSQPPTTEEDGQLPPASQEHSWEEAHGAS